MLQYVGERHALCPIGVWQYIMAEHVAALKRQCFEKYPKFVLA